MAKSKGRKAALLRSQTFQQGNNPWNKGNGGVHTVESRRHDFSRLSQNRYEDAMDPEHIEVMPTILRPTEREPSETEKLQRPVTFDRIIGNRIIHMQSMEDLVNNFLEEHHHIATDCSFPNVRFVAEMEVTNGLGVTEVLECTKCKYRSSPTHLYEELVVPGKRGRRRAVMTNQLGTACLYIPNGYTGARILLASIDVPCPSVPTMQYITNSVSDACLELCNIAIEENRTFLAKVLQLREQSRDTATIGIAAEADVMYNNPIKGRSFQQPGTQAVSTLIEQDTVSKMVVAMATVSKLCSNAQKLQAQGAIITACPNHDGVCQANYPQQKPIGNAESAMGQELVKQLNNSSASLHLSELCTDGDSKLLQGAYDAQGENVTIKKNICATHVSRNQRNCLYNAKLSNKLIGCKKNKSNFVKKLSNAIVKRCNVELRKAKQATNNKTVERLTMKVNNAKNNILDCFSGKHDNCRRFSFFCRHSKGTAPVPRYLPGHKYLTMEDTDREQLQKVIDKKLGPGALSTQMKLRTTNKSEAMHKRILKGVPKSNTWKRNHRGRCAAMIHEACNPGIGDSIIKINRFMGSDIKFGGPGAKHLNELQQKQIYDTGRKKSLAYLRKRKQLLKRALRCKVAHSEYKTGCYTTDHTYGLTGVD